MSLETDVANLVTKTTALLDYFGGKKTEIDKAVVAALAAIPEMSKSFYVDPVAGLDTNSGTAAAPIRTIERALAMTPANGYCAVYLVNDYTLNYQISMNCAYLYVFGVNATSSGIKPKLRLGYYPVTSDGATTTRLGGFLLEGMCSNIEIRSIDIVLPTTVGVVPAPTNKASCSLIRTNSISRLPPQIGVTLENLAVTNVADFFGCLIGVTASSVSLAVSQVSFPSDFGGKYISTVSAGTDPKTLSNVLTNVSAL